MKYPHAQVLIFAKQPISGAVKTRLIPAIGVDAATRLHCAMTRRVGSFRYLRSGVASPMLENW